MALEIFKLVGSIMVDNTKANESLSKTDDKAKGIGQRLASGIGTAAKWGAGIVAAAGAGAAALYGVATKSAETADHIDKMSQKIGISRTAYQELDFILSQNGMSVDQLQGGMKKLVNTMQSARDGSSSASATFEALGISVTDSSGALRNQEDVFYEVISVLQGMENETERNALANDIFGKSASEMAPLLNAGAGSMGELRQKAHDLGLVLSDETVDAGVAFTDTQGQVKRALASVTTQLGAEVMPIINDFLQWVLSHMPEIQAVIKVAFDAIHVVVQAVGKVISWLAGVFEKYMPAVQEAAQKAFSGIQDFWEQHLKPCFDAIGDFIQNVLAPIFEQVFNDFIAPAVEGAFKTIGDLWENSLKPILTGITDFLTGVFSGDFSKAFQGIVDIVDGIFSGIVTVVKNPINSVINIINGFIRGLNRIKIPSWVPFVGGKGINIPTIPTLETGGILEKGQVGYLEGNGAEAVVPLDKNKKWIRAVAQDMDSAMGGDGQTIAVLTAILALLEKISRMAVMLDTGAIVGGIAPAMDRQLGQIQAQKERS